MDKPATAPGQDRGWPRERPWADTTDDALGPSPAAAGTSDVITRGTPDAIALAEALFVTTHAMKYAGKSCADEDDPASRMLSMPRARLLAEVAAGSGTLQMSEVWAALGVTARNVTTIVDGLERLGLVRRRRRPGDRRANLLELTEQGHAHIEHIRALQRNLSERCFAPLDATERCELLRLLAKVRTGLESRIAELPRERA